MSVLWTSVSFAGGHVRPRRAESQGRHGKLGEYRHLLPLLQPEKRRANTRGGRNAIDQGSSEAQVAIVTRRGHRFSGNAKKLGELSYGKQDASSCLRRKSPPS